MFDVAAYNVFRGGIKGVHGLIDIHSHVIPAVDDGVADVAGSDEMFERYNSAGFRTVFATPHLSLAPDHQYEKSVAQGFSETKKRAQCHDLTLIEGKELRLSPEILLSGSELGNVGLGGTQFVLIDFPSGAWPYYAEDSIFQLQTMGFTPILAHPERYGWGPNHRDTPRELISRGVLIQVTLGSFVGAFGSHPRRAANELLRAGQVHFTATDAHSPGSRMKAALKGMDLLHKEFGAESVEKTLKENPMELLNEGQVEAFYPANRGKQWLGLDLRRLIQRA